MWYLSWTRTPDSEAGWAWITFLILYNNLIPISLYVTVEVVKVIHPPPSSSPSPSPHLFPPLYHM